MCNIWSDTVYLPRVSPGTHSSMAHEGRGTLLIIFLRLCMFWSVPETGKYGDTLMERKQEWMNTEADTHVYINEKNMLIGACKQELAHRHPSTSMHHKGKNVSPTTYPWHCAGTSHQHTLDGGTGGNITLRDTAHPASARRWRVSIFTKPVSISVTWGT